MAYKNFQRGIMAVLRDVVNLNFAIPTNGATTPVALGVRGGGFTVARTGVGVYTLTPMAGMKFPVQLGVLAQLRLATFVANQDVRVSTINASTGVITITHLNTTTGAAVEWPAANADNVLSVQLAYSNSSQAPNHP